MSEQSGRLDGIERRAEAARHATDPTSPSWPGREGALSASASDVLYLLGRLQAAEGQNRRLRWLVGRMGAAERARAELAWTSEQLGGRGGGGG